MRSMPTYRYTLTEYRPDKPCSVASRARPGAKRSRRRKTSKIGEGAEINVPGRVEEDIDEEMGAPLATGETVQAFEPQDQLWLMTAGPGQMTAQ